MNVNTEDLIVCCRIPSGQSRNWVYWIQPNGYNLCMGTRSPDVVYSNWIELDSSKLERPYWNAFRFLPEIREVVPVEYFENPSMVDIDFEFLMKISPDGREVLYNYVLWVNPLSDLGLGETFVFEGTPNNTKCDVDRREMWARVPMDIIKREADWFPFASQSKFVRITND